MCQKKVISFVVVQRFSLQTLVWGSLDRNRCKRRNEDWFWHFYIGALICRNATQIPRLAILCNEKAPMYWWNGNNNFKPWKVWLILHMIYWRWGWQWCISRSHSDVIGLCCNCSWEQPIESNLICARLLRIIW